MNLVSKLMTWSPAWLATMLLRCFPMWLLYRLKNTIDAKSDHCNRCPYLYVCNEMTKRRSRIICPDIMHDTAEARMVDAIFEKGEQ